MSVLDEQLSYYRARAPEYDEWWKRVGRYDQGPEALARWENEVKILEKYLEDFAAKGEVLELACGTGWWTEKLARNAVSLTCVDAAQETLNYNRIRLSASGLSLPRYIQADLFQWVPDRTYDVVFFSFWLSHVPLAKFTSFWNIVRTALRPGGRVLLIDSQSVGPNPTKHTELEDRQLKDGRSFTIVKRYYEPQELEEKLALLRWRAEIRCTITYFIFGSASPE